MGDIGRLILVVGLVLVGIGALMLLLGRIPGIGRLPGDFVWERGNVRVYVPLMTMLILSIIVSIILTLVVRWWR